MSPTVLDTSALLAWIREGTGADEVDPLLDEAVTSTVNLSGLAQKLTQHGVEAPRTITRLRTLGPHVEPFTDTDALAAVQLWSHTCTAGLSRGDRACLALALRLDAPVATAEAPWSTVETGVRIHLLR